MLLDLSRIRLTRAGLSPPPLRIRNMGKLYLGLALERGTSVGLYGLFSLILVENSLLFVISCVSEDIIIGPSELPWGL